MGKSITVPLVGLTLLLVTSAAASATTTFQGLYRYDYAISGDLPSVGIPVTDGKVLLSDYVVALYVFADGAQHGDEWRWQLSGPEGLSFGSATWTFYTEYGGAQDCWVFFGGIRFARYCNLPNYSSLAVGFNTRCQATGDYTMTVTGPGNAVIPAPFTVISTGPKVGVRLNPTKIRPKIVDVSGTQPPGTTEVTVAVTDSGCPNIPIKDADVTVTSLTVPGSGGHDHLNERPGFGVFKATSRSVSIKTLSTNGITYTAANGRTDEKGLLTGITYTAGEVGLLENITAIAAKRDPDIPQDTKGSSGLTIKVPGLEPLTHAPFAFFTGAISGKHTDNHYGTPAMNNKLAQLTTKYNDDITRKVLKLTSPYDGYIGINDMSLPFGGIFDLNTQFWVANSKGNGHFSHCSGIDVDFNRLDSKDRKIDLELLNKLSCRLGGSQRNSSGVHFRFDGRCIICTKCPQ